MTTYRVLSPRYRALPMPPLPAVVYWTERVCGWWSGFSRSCSACSGFLDADPPNAIAWGPGRVACVSCGREAAEVQQERRPEPRRQFSAAELAPRRGRPPKEMP